MTLGIEREGLAGPLREAATKIPVLGTCAGMIMLDRDHLDVLDIRAERNAFGRQLHSFEADLDLEGVPGGPVHAVFIRAPWVSDHGPDVEVLGRVDGHPVAIRQGNVLAVSFHPELSGEGPAARVLLLGLNGSEHPAADRWLAAERAPRAHAARRRPPSSRSKASQSNLGSPRIIGRRRLVGFIVTRGLLGVGSARQPGPRRPRPMTPQAKTTTPSVAWRVSDADQSHGVQRHRADDRQSEILARGTSPRRPGRHAAEDADEEYHRQRDLPDERRLNQRTASTSMIGPNRSRESSPGHEKVPTSSHHEAVTDGVFGDRPGLDKMS